MTTNIKQFAIKDPQTIRDDYLRTKRNALINRGVVNPNVSPGSDDFITATALGNELAVVEANAVVSGDQTMPDTSSTNTAGTGGLDRWLAIFGLSKRLATGSFGGVVLDSSAPSPVINGTQLSDGAGLIYQAAGGIYALGATIPVTAVSIGKATNHLAGDTLRWVTAPPFSGPNALVATGGLTGAVDAEDDDTARARLLSLFQNPSGSGNWQHVCSLAEASTAAVQKAFCYPAAQGPATFHFAVVTYATATSKNRDLDATTLNGTVIPYVKGLLPEHADITGTTVTNVPTDVSFGLSLPAAPTASPAGPGGGWLDGTPWPAISGTGTTKANVTAVTSTTVFTVNAPTAPTANVSRIAYLSPTTWTLYLATVLSFMGSAGAYVVTIDKPFVGVTIGNYVFPQAVNTAGYIATILKSFSLMGPGEKSASGTVLVRGYRHPVPQLSWPYALGGVQTKALTDSGSEVLDANYYFRSVTTPAVPGAITSPPQILTPGNIGIYPI